MEQSPSMTQSWRRTRRLRPLTESNPMQRKFALGSGATRLSLPHAYLLLLTEMVQASTLGHDGSWHADYKDGFTFFELVMVVEIQAGMSKSLSRLAWLGLGEQAMYRHPSVGSYCALQRETKKEWSTASRGTSSEYLRYEKTPTGGCPLQGSSTPAMCHTTS